ncbi:hypothetical protein OG883_36480 [Streptomyces sp. NBC_01142]|uniref:hypothetical protein n=1 Tax=Streptomyces sp. NBC_01142 TaxID=2975865 RepID=UPI002254D331|nr:hypothetical protein [Streptomyces sp. NBC_01142]MCX4825263.1 hypothetical protein [Streptomyces sp. NBC_01142]
MAGLHLAPGIPRRDRRIPGAVQLAVNYRRSPATADDPHAPQRGPRAGDRLPDTSGDLHALTAAPGFHLLLCGPRDSWDTSVIAAATRGHERLIHVHTPGTSAFWRGVAQGLVRPDGRIGYRAGGTDLTGLFGYLDRWLPLSEPGKPR